MSSVKELIQSADWKTEKHVPLIESEEAIKKGEVLRVIVSVGRQIPHPNTAEHHISWIAVYFLPGKEKFPYQVARFDFTAHGASTQGPNTSTIYSLPEATFSLKTEKSGRLLAVSYCNIHGLWESSKDIEAE
jgi:superoxide reductase